MNDPNPYGGFTLVPVSSSNINHIGYDKTNLLLTVVFNDGSAYDYYDVPLSIYQQLMGSPSKGGFLHRHIKNKFKFRKVL